MKGFTLIEILLVIAIVLTVGFFSTAFPLRMMSQMAISNSADKIRSVLWKTEAYAKSGREHSAWCVHYDNSKITLFKGDSYNNRDQSFDEKTAINERVSITGLTDVIFTVPGGRPQAPISNIILTRDNSTTSLSLNAEGVIK